MLLIFHAALCKSSNKLPRHRIWIEVLLGVDLAEELHPQDGEDVDDDDEEEGEVPEGAQGGDDDAQQDLHRGPRLGEFQHSHLKEKNRFMIFRESEKSQTELS